MSIFKKYDIIRVLESIEELMDRYFKLVRKHGDPMQALDALFNQVYPESDNENATIRKNTVDFISVRLMVYPESEKMKYFVKTVILDWYKGIRQNSKDDHEINRKLYLTYKSMRLKYGLRIDGFNVEDIDRLGYWESLSSPMS